jgi:preprotein translocase SecE subunit
MWTPASLFKIIKPGQGMRARLFAFGVLTAFLLWGAYEAYRVTYEHFQWQEEIPDPRFPINDGVWALTDVGNTQMVLRPDGFSDVKNVGPDRIEGRGVLVPQSEHRREANAIAAREADGDTEGELPPEFRARGLIPVDFIATRLRPDEPEPEPRGTTEPQTIPDDGTPADADVFDGGGDAPVERTVDPLTLDDLPRNAQGAVIADDNIRIEVLYPAEWSTRQLEVADGAADPADAGPAKGDPVELGDIEGVLVPQGSNANPLTGEQVNGIGVPWAALIGIGFFFVFFLIVWRVSFGGWGSTMLIETDQELAKVVWPTRELVVASSFVVMLSVVVFSILLFASDFVLNKLIVDVLQLWE